MRDPPKRVLTPRHESVDSALPAGPCARRLAGLEWRLLMTLKNQNGYSLILWEASPDGDRR